MITLDKLKPGQLPKYKKRDRVSVYETRVLSIISIISQGNKILNRTLREYIKKYKQELITNKQNWNNRYHRIEKIEYKSIL